MGLSQSKLFSQKLEKACRDCESSGKDDISDMLLNPEVCLLQGHDETT